MSMVTVEVVIACFAGLSNRVCSQKTQLHHVFSLP